MTILDKRAEKLHHLQQQSLVVQTMSGWVNLEQEKHVLREELRAEYIQVNRLAQGWTFIPPRKP